MELKHLRYFVAAVEEGSLLAGAERLAIAQPALSRRIQDLEAELGCALLVRSVRGVTPTGAGMTLYREALEVLGKVGDALQQTRKAGFEQDQEFRLGLVWAARKYPFIRDAVVSYAKDHPGAGVAFTRGGSLGMSSSLREGRLDATLLHDQRLTADRFGERIIHRERYVLAAHPEHRLAQPGPIELSELAGEPFVWLLRPFQPDDHDPLLEHCRIGGLEPVMGQLANGPEELLDLVSIGGGICLTTASTMGITSPGQVVFRAVPGLGRELPLTLAWRRNLEAAPVLAFLEHLHAAIDRHQAAIDSGAVPWTHLDGLQLVRTR